MASIVASMLAALAAALVLSFSNAVVEAVSAELPEGQECVEPEECEPEVSLLQVGFDKSVIAPSHRPAALTQSRQKLRGELHTDLIATLGDATGSLWSVAISPCGNFLASASADNNVRVYALTKLHSMSFPLTLMDAQDQSSSVAFWQAEDGGLILGTGDFTGTWRLYGLDTAKVKATLLATTKECDMAVEGIAFSPDTPVMASVCSGGNVRLHDISSPGAPNMVEDINPGGNPISVSLTPLGHRLALGLHEGTLKVWSTNKSGLALRDVDATLGDHINNVAFSSDNNLLAAATWDGSATLYGNIMEPGGSMKPLSKIEGATDKLNSVTFNHDNTLLATGGWDGKARIYDITVLSEPVLLATLDDAQDPLRSITFGHTSGHDVLATAGKDAKVRLYRVERV